MQKMKKSQEIGVKNWLNAKQFPDNYREIIGPDMTIPDQTLSIREIIDRYARGFPMPLKSGFFEGEEGFGRELKSMDLVDKQELLETSKIALKQAHERQTKKIENPAKTSKKDISGTVDGIDDSDSKK